MSAPALKLVDSVTGELVDGSDHELLELIKSLEHDLSLAERDLRAKRNLITKLQRDRERERQAHEHRDEIEHIFSEWQTVCRKARSKLTADRFDAVSARLADGYDRGEFSLAIAGAAYDPFTVVLKNGRRQPMNDLELICRDGRHFENFANRAPQPSSQPP